MLKAGTGAIRALPRRPRWHGFLEITVIRVTVSVDGLGINGKVERGGQVVTGVTKTAPVHDEE